MDSTIQLTTLQAERNPRGSVDNASLAQDRHGLPEDQLEEVSEDVQHPSQSLPPVDGGWQAWTFLAACFTLEAIVWGL